MAVPIITEPLVSVPDMTFAHWLPTKKDDFVISEEENITIKMWFDEDLTNSIFNVDISKAQNVTIDKVYIDAIIKNIDPELFSYIQNMNPKTGPTSEQEEIHSHYQKLGEKVYKSTLKNFNLLIKYCRDIKGQYWLEEYPINVGRMQSRFNQFGAKVKVEDGEWFKWRPTGKEIIKVKR